MSIGSRVLILVLTVAAAGGTVASNAAANEVFPLDDSPPAYGSGVALTGGAVTWIADEQGHAVVRSQPLAGGPSRRLMVLPDATVDDPVVTLGIHAEGRGIVSVSQRVETCQYGCGKGGGPEPVSFQQWSGPVGGPLTELGRCTAEVGPDFVVTGRAPVYEGQTPECPPAGMTITGTGALTGVSRLYPNATFAGHYALTQSWDYDAGTSEIRVADWTTGVDRYVVSATGRDVLLVQSLAADGGLLYSSGGYTAGEIRHYVSPTSPTPQVVTLPPQAAATKLAGRQVAWSAYGQQPANGDSNDIGVTSVDGRTVMTSDSGSPAYGVRHFDFDGRNLVWLTAVCARPRLAVWDVTTAPPRLSARCGVPTIRVHKHVTVKRTIVYGTSLAVRAACPKSSADGCSGTVSWLSANGKHTTGALQTLKLAPGARATILPPTMRLTGLRRGHTRTVSVTVALDGTQRTRKLRTDIRVRMR